MEHIFYALLVPQLHRLLAVSPSGGSGSPASPSRPFLGTACRAGRLGPRGEGVERSSGVYFCA